MENKNKNIKITICIILVIILISVIGIVIFSMNKNQVEKDGNTMPQNQAVQNQNIPKEDQIQNQVTNTVNNISNNENVVIPKGSEEEEPPEVVSTPTNGKDKVDGSGHTE